MIHPFAERWRARHLSYHRSPYLVLLPVWVAMWFGVALVTRPWRDVLLYRADWAWGAAVLLFVCGLYVYSQSLRSFSAQQLGGLPEVHGGNREQQLVTDGIRSRVRHPVYLAHLCEMLAWSAGTGLAVCWALTAFAVITGAVMIRMEDAELEKRFGGSYRAYRRSVPAVVPRVFCIRVAPHCATIRPMSIQDKPPKGQPIALDPSAKSASLTEPAFIARPVGAPVYHGFEVLDDVSADGFVFGKITDFEAEAADCGDAFVIAPDNSRAGIVWEVSETQYFTEVCPIEAARWGVWAVSFPLPMNKRENVRRNLQSVLPTLKEKWEEWRERYGS